MKTPLLVPNALKFSLLAAGALVLAGSASAGHAGVTVADHTGSKATLLAIDDVSLPLRENLCYYLSEPSVRAEPVLTPSRDRRAPDASSTHCYGTVLQDGGKFRMWYYGLGWKDNPEGKADEKSVLHEGPVCYAESADGIRWVKPILRQVECNGSRENNGIALPAANTEGTFVINDESDPDPSRRYKMIYENTSGKHPIVDSAVSADGLVWRGTGTAARNLEPSSFYLFNGLYTISAQNTVHFGEGGHRTGRQGFVWVSPDFRHWLSAPGEAFTLPEPLDPNARGSDRPYTQVHLGVGAFNYGNVLVGLYCQWHARPNPGDWFGDGTTFGDFGLLVSNDGQHFREVVKGYVYLNRHHSRAAISPDIRSEEILTQSGNSILNVGDETRIYHGRWMNTEKAENYYAEIALATLPRDRWGALGLVPHAAEGSVWSAPLSLGQQGGRLALNAQGVQGVRVEVADRNFGLIPEFSGENAGTVTGGDGLDCAVAWPKASLDSLSGKNFRLLIHLKKGGGAEPRLFAAYLSSN